VLFIKNLEFWKLQKNQPFKNYIYSYMQYKCAKKKSILYKNYKKFNTIKSY
jgi:hypothetical protein